MTDLILSIDLGTQSTRAAILDLAGEVVAISISPEQSMHIPQTGWAEQNPQMWWQHVKQTIHACLSQGVDTKRIAAIGVSGQMHGCIPINKTGELLSTSVQLWCDKRFSSKAEALNQGSNAALLQAEAANMAIGNWHGLKISWLKSFVPELYEKTWKFLTPKDYINFKLSGEIATDYSEASGSFLMNAEGREWSPLLAEALTIELDKLPGIVKSSQVIGGLHTQAARETGLRKGIPVVAGGGDMLCMLLAAGLSKAGIASDITGTSSIFSVFTPKPVLDYRIMNLHHVLEGWVPFGLLDSGGVSLRWFRDAFGQAQVQEAARQGVSSYAYLSQLAENCQADRGLIFLPHLMGERTLGSPHARGVFFGLSPQHGVAEAVRAIMVGVTFDLKRVLDQVLREGFPVDVIYHSGGGAKSSVWSQIKADIYQRPVKTFVNNEGGILGAAILAATGVGLYASEREGAERCLQFADAFEPNTSRRDFYQTQYEAFVRIHDLLQDEFERLGKTS